MTDSERIAWLSQHPVNSRWDLRDGRQLWTVTVFFATGHGWSFAEALDDAIRVYADREAEAQEDGRPAVARRFGAWKGVAP